MTTKTFINYEKNYLPGYTGHVPKKNEIYGCTAGDINNLLTGVGQKPSSYDVDITVSKPNFEKRDYHAGNGQDTEQATVENMQYGNHSLAGKTWIGGPKDTLKQQHVPGYAGYIPQVQSENLYGKGYSKITANAINGDYDAGFDHPNAARFTTEAMAEFNKSNFRKLNDEMDPAEVKDINDAYNFHDAEFQGIEITEKRAYMDLPTVGYQGFKSLYRMPTTQVNHRKDPFFNINPLRPKLNTTDVTEKEEYQNLSQTQKSALNSSAYREALGLPDKSKMQLPVVGYTGHRMGYKSQNFYGKNYKDCTIQSKVVHKMASK